MIRRRQVATVAEFEFLSIVRTVGYILSTLGLPALLLVYGLVAERLGTYLEGQIDGGAKIVGVIDAAGMLDLAEDRRSSLIELPEHLRALVEGSGADTGALGPLAYFTDTVFRGFEDLESGKAALLADEIAGLVTIPADFLTTGVIDSYAVDEISIGGNTAHENLARSIRDRLLLQVPEAVRGRIENTVANTREWIVEGDGSVRADDMIERALRFGVPGALMLVFLISLMTTTGYLVQGTSTEKETRVVEVLLSAASPDEILAGKLLGLGVAGLLQVLVWFSMVIVGAAMLAGVALAAGVGLPVGAFAIGTVFFVAAYFFYGSMMLALASFGNTEMEGQKLAGFWVLLAVLPMLFFPVLINEPNGTVAQTLSWIPFSAPMAVLARLALSSEGVAWWDLTLALTILLASTWVGVKLGARLYRIGLLATGGRPKLREIWRQARLSP